MKSALDKQATHLANIDKTLQQDKLLQLSQVVLQAKTDSNLNKDQEEANTHLDKIEKANEKTASNISDLFKAFKEYFKSYNTVSKDSMPSSEKRSLWSGTAQDRKEFKTPRGFLTQSGLISKDGTISKYLEEREKPTVEKASEKAKAGKTPAEKANANDPLSFSDEGQLEQQRTQEKSVALLEKIEENTRGMTKGTAPEASSGAGLLDGIMSFIGPAFMKVFKAIFNPRNLLKAFTKVFVPAMIIGSIINGIVDAFKTFFSGGSFTDVIIAGLGGVLDFLTFGLIDAKTIKKISDWIGGFVDEYIINPIKDFASYIGESFNKYIAEPLKSVFAPITNFFKQIKDQVFGFLEDFGIPEIGFTIPVINKKVSIGPFYPFRAQESANKTQTTSESSQKTTFSKSNTNTTLTNVTEITKEDEAYQKLGFFDKLKVDTGFAKATELVKIEKPSVSTGNAVYDQSSKNTEMAMKPAPVQAPVVVSNSTTNNTTKQSIAMPAPVRNQDSEFGRYVNRRALAM